METVLRVRCLLLSGVGARMQGHPESQPLPSCKDVTSELTGPS